MAGTPLPWLADGGPAWAGRMYVAGYQGAPMPMLAPSPSLHPHPSQSIAGQPFHAELFMPQPPPQRVPQPHQVPQTHQFHSAEDEQVRLSQLVPPARGQHAHDRGWPLEVHSPTRLNDLAQHGSPSSNPHGYPQHSHTTPSQRHRPPHHADSCPTCGAALSGSARRPLSNTPRVLETPLKARRSARQSLAGLSLATNSLVEQLETATQDDIRERIRTLRLTHSFLARPDASEEDAKDARILELKISASEAMLKELVQTGVEASVTPVGVNDSQPVWKEEGKKHKNTTHTAKPWVVGGDACYPQGARECNPNTESRASAAVTADPADDAASFNDFNFENYTTIPETPIQHAVPNSDTGRPPLPPPRAPVDGAIPSASERGLLAMTDNLRLLQCAPHGLLPSAIEANAHGGYLEGSRPTARPSPAQRVPLHGLVQRGGTDEPGLTSRLDQLPGMDEVLRDWSSPRRDMRVAPVDPEDAPSVRAAPSPAMRIMQERGPPQPPGLATPVEFLTIPRSPGPSPTLKPERWEPEVTMAQSSNTNQLIAKYESQRPGRPDTRATSSNGSSASSWLNFWGGQV